MLTSQFCEDLRLNVGEETRRIAFVVSSADSARDEKKTKTYDFQRGVQEAICYDLGAVCVRHSGRQTVK